jgi:hypothetical protein
MSQQQQYGQQLQYGQPPFIMPQYDQGLHRRNQQGSYDQTQYGGEGYGESGYALNPFTQSTVYAEMISYAPEVHRLRNPFSWIQFLNLLWHLTWLVIFTIMSLGSIRWMRQWGGLLGYVLGSALFFIFELCGYWWYIIRNDLITSYRHHHITGHNELAPQNNHYMGIHHSKELGMGALISAFASAIVSWVWWSWLCNYKGACNFTEGRLSPDPFDFNEDDHFGRMTVTGVFITFVSICYFFRAMYAHWKPLRTITYAIKATPVGNAIISNEQGHVGIHPGQIHYESVNVQGN